LRKIVFIDEAHKYFSKAPEDVLNVIAKEARKFGLGLWCASQQPTEFPESFLTNVGTTMLLGIHSSFWKRTSVMLRISEDELRAIRPKEVMAVKMMRDGEADPPFQVTIVPNPKTEAGRRAAAKMSPARAA
jgi:DNA helicase HerA-like ATPase